MGASHGIGHVLGGSCDVPHYYCTSVLMPSVLRYNKPFTETAQRRLADALGATDGDASTAFAQLVQKLGLPQRLIDVGVGEDKFALVSNVAINHRLVRANPRPFEARRILSSCCASRRRPAPSPADRCLAVSQSRLHRENHAEARLARHHLGVRLRRFFERHGLDHGGDAGKRTKP
jgi:Iron-containing alcohol dehydrogenase